MIPLKDDNSVNITPYISYFVLALCISVYIWQHIVGFTFSVYAYGLIPAVLFTKAQLPPDYDLISSELTLITSMFLHGSILHILGNLLFLKIFADNVEESMGHFRFIMFFLVTGVVAALVHAIGLTRSEIPMVGASGAISGIMGAYFLLFPRAKITLFIPLIVAFPRIKVPAMILLGSWFLLQLVLTFNVSDQESNIAYSAHIGGFICGMLILPLFKRDDVKLWQGPDTVKE